MEGVVRRVGFVAVVAIAAGCGKRESHALMPLDVGRSWTYEIRLGAPKRVERVEVARAAPVAGVMGAELSGPLGVSRVAWIDDQLVTDAGAHARFSRPLPLLDTRHKTVEWRGQVTTVASPRDASAVTTTVKEDLTWKGRKRATVHSTVNVQLPDKSITLDTWFLSGVGIVKQEQRTGVRLDDTMTLITEG